MKLSTYTMAIFLLLQLSLTTKKLLAKISKIKSILGRYSKQISYFQGNSVNKFNELTQKRGFYSILIHLIIYHLQSHPYVLYNLFSFAVLDEIVFF